VLQLRSYGAEEGSSVTTVTPHHARAACFRDVAQIVAQKAEFKPNHPVVPVAMLLDFRSTGNARAGCVAARQMDPQ
jgi:hypothetical protein